MTREQAETAAITRLGLFSVTAYTTDQVSAEDFAFPDTYAEVRVAPTSRGLPKGSATSLVGGWQLEVEIVGRLAVNVNRYLDRCHAAFYGHRLVVGSSLSTPMQEGPSDSPDKTGDDRFTAFSEWTFAL